MANSITTIAAREKFAKAHRGDITLPKITQVGWGDAGHDSNRNPITPTGSESMVPGEFTRKNIDGSSYPIPTTLRLNVSLLASEGNGKDVSACGLYDSQGTLIALKTFKPKAKDDETEIYITWDEEF